MTLKEKKISVLITTSLDDLLTGLDQMGLAIDNIESKGIANGWTLAQINTMKINELQKMRKMAHKAVESAVQGAGIMGDMERASGGNFDAIFVWQATGAKGGVCPSCVELNGTRKTYGDWAIHGFPGNAFAVMILRPRIIRT